MSTISLISISIFVFSNGSQQHHDQIGVAIVALNEDELNKFIDQEKTKIRSTAYVLDWKHEQFSRSCFQEYESLLPKLA